MMGMWMAGLTGGDQDSRQQQQQAAMGMNVAELRTELREMRGQIGKLALMNQALWELLCQRLQLTDDDLAKIAQEIDLRDGTADGKMTESPVRCPQCGRISNSRHWKCLYCGLQFEKPAMG
ncbi:MAG: hypothetical protein NTZ09_15455 [Candidatus Hydrogenedentes bacterium]|nr:hypothetical protein [Candidatus Hydrogenedentota bacterium]